MLPDTLATAIREACGDALLLDARRGAGIVTDIARLYDTCQRLRNAGWDRCVDVTGMDLGPATPGSAGAPAREAEGEEKTQAMAPALPNSEVFQLFLLLRHHSAANASLQLKWKYTQTSDSFHPSLSRIWPSAGLAERELWEMFGIALTGNDSLEPLLLDPQFDGYPLRREFELQPQPSYAAGLLEQRHRTGLVGAHGNAPGSTSVVPGAHSHAPLPGDQP